jgi:integrase
MSIHEGTTQRRTGRQRGRGQGSLFRRSPGGPWYMRWYGHDGKRPEQSTGTTDRRVAEQILRSKLSRVAMVRHGLASPNDILQAEAATTPLATHLADYEQALLDGVASARQKGPATAKHAGLVKQRVESMLEGLGGKHARDIKPEAVGRYLADRRTNGLSAQSANHIIASAKAFLNWMVRVKRIRENPIANLNKQQVTPKLRKRIRRALEPAEAAALLAATRHGTRFYHMEPEARYWLYRLALETGLRSGELRALKRENLSLSGPAAHVWLSEDETKNRKSAEIPLKHETAREILPHLAGKNPGDPVFDMPDESVIAYVLRHDLKEAGISHKTDAGVIDFHALRTTCISWLAAANVPLKTLQTFARHSTPVLTMNVYARDLDGTLADAAEKLPDLSRKATNRKERHPSTTPRPFRPKARQLARDSGQNGAAPCDENRPRNPPSIERKLRCHIDKCDSERNNASLGSVRVPGGRRGLQNR